MLWSEVFTCDCIICELGSLVKQRFNCKDIYRILRQNRLIFDTQVKRTHGRQVATRMRSHLVTITYAQWNILYTQHLF